jgi:hypothetical protein
MNSGRRTFDAPWSKTTWISTLCVILLVFVAIPVWLAYAILVHPGPVTGPVLVALIVDALLIVTLLISALFAPRRYSITASSIVIHRRGRDISIDLQSIHEVRRLAGREIRWAFRVCGVAGFFGTYGYFYHSKLGNFTAYITTMDSIVLIQYGKNRKMVLSPADPDRFVEAIDQTRSLPSAI